MQVENRGAGAILRRIPVVETEWHNIELREVRSLRADLLGEIQLQSPNDVNVAEVCSRDTPAVQAFAGTTGASFNVGLKPARMFAGLEGAAPCFLVQGGGRPGSGRGSVAGEFPAVRQHCRCGDAV